ncbi:MAG: hypothetical protein FIB05_12435 [Betaproteobacteria bacterium]|nr:hypothetical protein [Betaproteobacteria bacterium]
MALPGGPWRTAAFAVGALAAALAAVVAANRFDQDLLPETRDYYASGFPPDLSGESGFALIVGLSAPAGEDPRRFALDWSESVKARARDGRRLPDAGRLDVLAAPEVICRPEAFDCAARLGGKPQAVADLVADNAVLLRRYRELQGLSGLGDAGLGVDLEGPFVRYGVVLQAQGIFLSEVAAKAAAGDFDGALRDLEADAAFYRRWLAEGRLIIAKMVALRGLTRDLQLATQLARRAGGATPGQYAALRRIATPLTRAQRAMRNAIRFEAAIIPPVVDRALEGRKARERLLAGEGPLAAQLMGIHLLRNATLNHAHRFYLLWEALDEVESRDLPERIAETRRLTDGMARPQWHWLYNFGGKLLVARSWTGLDSYIYRIRDVDALANAACAMFDLREKAIPPESVEDYLANSATACRDPYTGQPFKWDRATRRLWTASRDGGAEERFGGDGRIAVSPY